HIRVLIEVCAELYAVLALFESDDSARAHIKQRGAGQLLRVACDVERNEIPGSLLARSVCGHNASCGSPLYAKLIQRALIIAPMLAHFHEQFQVYVAAQQLFNVPPRMCAYL